MSGIQGEKLTLAGPAGALEALLEHSSDNASPAAIAVVCHPHPLFQGTMHNKVVYTLARALAGLGAWAVRFNFRGVGQSEGEYDEGRGETDDALAVAAWMRKRHPHAPLWLAGFSFGAGVALHAAAQLEPAALVTVAPPVGKLEWQPFKHPHCPWLLPQGEDDDVVDSAAVLDWANGLDPKPDIATFPGVGHFFHGNLNALRDTITERLPRLIA